MNKATNCALVLIALAMAGAAVSYHFTLEARFSELQQKLDQNAVALQQCQISQETAASSKTDALNNLSKEVDSLQASLEPLGKATQEQTASLAEIRKQVASLQQSQVTQQDSQKKISEYAGQLDKIKHDVVSQVLQAPAPVVASTPASVAVTTPATSVAPAVEIKPAVVVTPVAVAPAPVATPAPAPVAATPPVAPPVTSPVAMPVIAPRASAANASQSVPVRADNAMIDLRPDETVRTVSTTSVRVQPVELSQK